MSGSTISTTITKEIVLGGSYSSPLTVGVTINGTVTGAIMAPAPNTGAQPAGAVFVSISGAGIVNYGVISAAIPVTNSFYIVPAILALTTLSLGNFGSGSISGQSGVYLQNGGTITNTGSIAGLGSAGHGGYGVRLVNAALSNYGVVYGKRYGIAATFSSDITNSGTIIGGTAGVTLISVSPSLSGTLFNSGRISGGSFGVSESYALINNSAGGTITGGTIGIRITEGGKATNSGLVSAGVEGVILLNTNNRPQYITTFKNYGTIQGGFYGMAANLAAVTNAAPGLITGATFGAGIGDNGYLYNAGSIYGAIGGLVVEGADAGNAGTIDGNQFGIELLPGSVMTNTSAGDVYSLHTAAVDQAAELVNAGTLAGDTYGLVLLSGGIALNSGTISSQREGVYLSQVSATSSPDFLANTGTVYGGQIGVNLRTGSLNNLGTIDSRQIGVTLTSGATFNNPGDVYGGRYGVELSGGTLVNAGSIGGGSAGIDLTQGYVLDSGTILGATNAVYGTAFTLTVDPGAVFHGKVVDKNDRSRLNLSGSSAGTLGGLGVTINAFDTINFDAGAQWLISGTSAGLAAGQVITGFEQGDTIILNGISASSGSYVSGRGLILNAGTLHDTLDITGSVPTFTTTGDFVLNSSGTSTSITLGPNAPCFVAGTRILTARGEVAVEHLAVGETVITLSGEDRPILWIGKRTIELRLHPRPEQVQPICIGADALADNVPRRELWVSPDHALLIDGVLVPAQLLLNGMNIRRGAPARVTYYHLELAEHAVIFAENAPAETYLETGNRTAFEHEGGGVMLHPDFSAMVRQQKSCAPLLLSGPSLEEINRRCLRRHVPDRLKFSA